MPERIQNIEMRAVILKLVKNNWVGGVLIFHFIVGNLFIYYHYNIYYTKHNIHLCD